MKENDNKEGHVYLELEYDAYLQEVVQVLEGDSEFRAKLEKANPDDIKSGKIAEELDFLHHNVRTQLHEIKRREIERLRRALREQMERENGIDNLVMPGHLDHENIDTFEQEDLRKLILKTTRDLEELDAKRRKEYKEYEMQKEMEFRQQLVTMTEEERQNAMKEREAAQKRHGEHPDVKHPGSKAQLEEVWENVDKLSKDTFDPRTFFKLHDITGDGVLDMQELEAVLIKQVDKVYNESDPDDDMRQKDEEVARMREHVMKEVDTNKDGLISLEEFLADASKPDFEQDEGWETLEKKKVYSEEDLKAYADQWAKATVPPYGGYPPPYPPAGYPQQQYGQYPPQQYPNQPYQYQPYQQQQMVGQPGVPPQQVYGQYQQPPMEAMQQQQAGFNQPQVQQQPMQGQGQVPQQPVQGQVPQGQPPYQQPVQGQPQGQPQVGQGQAPGQQQPIQVQPPYQQPIQGQVPQGQPQMGQGQAQNQAQFQQPMQVPPVQGQAQFQQQQYGWNGSQQQPIAVKSVPPGGDGQLPMAAPAA